MHKKSNLTEHSLIVKENYFLTMKKAELFRLKGLTINHQNRFYNTDYATEINITHTIKQSAVYILIFKRYYVLYLALMYLFKMDQKLIEIRVFSMFRDAYNDYTIIDDIVLKFLFLFIYLLQKSLMKKLHIIYQLPQLGHFYKYIHDICEQYFTVDDNYCFFEGQIIIKLQDLMVYVRVLFNVYLYIFENTLPDNHPIYMDGIILQTFYM